MPTAFSIDGAAVAADAALVPVMDRGFLYGDSVFEVMRTYAGVPFGAEEHLARLFRSLDRMEMPALGIDERALLEEIRETIARAEEPECYVRIVVTRGGGPIELHPGNAGPSRRVIIAAPLAPIPEERWRDGIEVSTVRVHRATDATRAMGAKVSAYVANMLALMSARERGGAEALMVGEGGEISEGNSSNVFVVEGGALRTPPVSMGLLPGITRAFTIRAAADLGIACREDVLFARDLERADEVVVTSSLREVLPAVRVDGRVIGDGRPGAVAARLRARYRELVALRCGGLG